jgi:hypothetical protein
MSRDIPHGIQLVLFSFGFQDVQTDPVHGHGIPPAIVSSIEIRDEDIFGARPAMSAVFFRNSLLVGTSTGSFNAS